MKKLLPIYTIVLLISSCDAQQSPPQIDKPVGGPCENCYELSEYGDQPLAALDTLPDFEKATTPIKISGTVYQKDGRTPAKDVILFVYQTDENGRYQMLTGNDRSHLHRAWIKTGADGRYAFYTFLPGSYPGSTEPRHIHPVIKEPGKTAYYIDDFVFDNDTLLTQAKRARLSNRGGSGIVELVGAGAMQTGKRNIYLGKNIPGYNE